MRREFDAGIPRSSLTADSVARTRGHATLARHFGFQYPEWKGAFIPATLSAAKDAAVLRGAVQQHGEQLFIPDDSEREDDCALGAETPERFKFSFKAPQRVTHFAKLRDCGGTVGVFRDAVVPLGAKLGAVLFQLPPTFKKGCGVCWIRSPRIAGGNACGVRVSSRIVVRRRGVWMSAQAPRCAVHRGERGAETPPVATADFGYLRLASRRLLAPRSGTLGGFVRSQSGLVRGVCLFQARGDGAGPKFAQQFKS